MWLPELRRQAQIEVPWVWHGYLAGGNVTLLTSQWKSGKTTLVSVLLARLGAGGELAGRAVRAGKAVIVSEESPELWEERSRVLDFGDHLCWLCRPFCARPRPEDWQALLDRIAELHARHGLAVVVIDPLSTFLPGPGENCAAPLQEALTPVHRLTNKGLAVLLLHHPRKKPGPAGMSARGSGALSAFADILVEMSWLSPDDPADRRRVLRTFSRLKQAPPGQVIELNEAGTDYRSLGDLAAAEFDQSWHGLQEVLRAAEGKLPQKEILARWPLHLPRPSAVTLWRWLQTALCRGFIAQDGTGHTKNPFRYWLPARLEEWRQDPVYLLREQTEQALAELGRWKSVPGKNRR
jgi:hypothetical protein